ncbi:hypothetical protein ABZP36_031142 [Zizania latifolia]
MAAAASLLARLHVPATAGRHQLLHALGRRPGAPPSRHHLRCISVPLLCSPTPLLLGSRRLKHDAAAAAGAAGIRGEKAADHGVVGAGDDELPKDHSGGISSARSRDYHTDAARKHGDGGGAGLLGHKYPKPRPSQPQTN